MMDVFRLKLNELLADDGVEATVATHNTDDTLWVVSVGGTSIHMEQSWVERTPFEAAQAAAHILKRNLKAV